MGSTDAELREAALTYLDESVYAHDTYQSDASRMAGARELPLDVLYRFITVAQHRTVGMGGTEVLRGICSGKAGSAAEASKVVRTLYRLDARRTEAHLGIGPMYRTLQGLTGDGRFPDWDDEQQRAAAEPLLAFALASLGHRPRPGIERLIDGTIRYTEPSLRAFVAAHPEDTARITELYCGEGMRLEQLREVLDGSPALSEGAL